MAHKIKFKGKIYTVIEVLDVGDASIIKRKAKVKSSKGEIFIFIQSVLGYYLYNDKNQRVAETLSVQEWTT